MIQIKNTIQIINKKRKKVFIYSYLLSNRDIPLSSHKIAITFQILSLSSLYATNKCRRTAKFPVRGEVQSKYFWHSSEEGILLLKVEELVINSIAF